jgi:C4-dicarboxylate-specific signal transduction histidine kinase
LRTGQIIERIRKFVTRHEPRREAFDPNQVVHEVEEILRDEANQRRVTVAMNLAPNLPNLWGDPGPVKSWC